MQRNMGHGDLPFWQAKLFDLAEQVDFAERAFHDALARRNKAQIACLRQPNTLSHKAFEAAKKAEAIALEFLDTEVRRLASTRATTVIGLKPKASYASTEAKLADSIIEDTTLRTGKRDSVPFWFETCRWTADSQCDDDERSTP